MSGSVVRPAREGLAGPARLGQLLAACGPADVLILAQLGRHAGPVPAAARPGPAVTEVVDALTSALLAAALDPCRVEAVALTGEELAIVMRAPSAQEPSEVAVMLDGIARGVSGRGTSCGIAQVREDRAGSVDVRRTVRDAGLALRAALRQGGGSVTGRSDGGDGLSLAEEEDLDVRTSLRSGEFALHFQPLVDPSTSQPLGIEALVRGRSAGGVVIGPGGFLPQVRRSGLSVELGTAILSEALGRWSEGLRAALARAAGGRRVLLSVNVDADQVEHDGFDRLVADLLDRYQVPAEELVLEVTEAILASAAAGARLQLLRDRGVRVAIDDFGAGPVVLSELGQLPVDILKVDQVLVGRLDPERPDVGLIEDLQRLATLLGLQLAVEAVETPALAARIAQLGVPIAQGYHYARPMPPDELVSWAVTSG